MFEHPPPGRMEAALQFPEHSAEHSERLIVFILGSTVCAVALEAVQEITLMARLSTPSGSPSLLAGFLNLGQRPIAVIRLHKLLATADVGHGLYTQILILRESNGMRVGWIVDRVTQIISRPRAEIMPVPESQCFQDCAEGTFTWNEANVTILSPDRILLEKERRSIGEFSETEMARLRDLETLNA